MAATPAPSPLYDIFISYRHNDNLDGWVTDFVQHLEKELRATLKEPPTIYFDKNPHDGLQETHDVGKSLEEKLKCIILIPIISQTYCDPKSFAWQHEFCAFNTIAKTSPAGRDIRLANGNVASRILPVKIHDLDADDNESIEKELNAPLRAIEFIYREPGVNRPLRSSEEDPSKNLAQTVYRNQLNKVAQAIKQIIAAMKEPAHKETPIKDEAAPLRPRRKYARVLATSFVVLVLVALGYLGATQLRKGAEANVVADKSIAVLPFVNMSNDPDQEYFSDGISEEILNLLAKVPELKVIGRTSSFYFKGKNEDLRIIGEKLGASYVLEGSLRKDGNLIRITAQLIKASDGTHLWSETFERKLENIFQLQDEIASNVLRQLKLKLLATAPQKILPNQDAYNLLLKGRYFVDEGDFNKGLDFFQQSLALDSLQAIVWTSLAQVMVTIASRDFSQFEKNSAIARRYALKALSIDQGFSDAHRALGLVYMFYDFDFDKARRELNIALQLDPNNSDAYRNLGQLEGTLGNLDAALVALRKSVDLNPLSYLSLTNLSGVYSNRGEFEKAEKILQQSLEMSSAAEGQLFTLYFFWGKIDQAEKLFERAFAGRDPEEREIIRSMLTYAAGKKNNALEDLRRLAQNYHGNSYRLAEAFAFMDQPDEGFFWLSKAYEERFRMYLIKRSAPFMKYHDDPRYIAILKKMNLPI